MIKRENVTEQRVSNLSSLGMLWGYSGSGVLRRAHPRLRLKQQQLRSRYYTESAKEIVILSIGVDSGSSICLIHFVLVQNSTVPAVRIKTNQDTPATIEKQIMAQSRTNIN